MNLPEEEKATIKKGILKQEKNSSWLDFSWRNRLTTSINFVLLQNKGKKIVALTASLISWSELTGHNNQNIYEENTLIIFPHIAKVNILNLLYYTKSIFWW